MKLHRYQMVEVLKTSEIDVPLSVVGEDASAIWPISRRSQVRVLHPVPFQAARPFDRAASFASSKERCRMIQSRTGTSVDIAARP